MSFFNILFIGIGLSMDAFAVSIAKSMTMKKEDLKKYAFIFALFFGGFQALMPLLGWLLGSYFEPFFNQYAHWIACILLLFIGINMIKESFDDEDNDDNKLDLKAIILLAIATSIDAFAVGVSFAFMQTNILFAIMVIGITTAILSFIATFIGSSIGRYLEHYAGVFGGIVLIFIGIKFVLEHYLF